MIIKIRKNNKITLKIKQYEFEKYSGICRIKETGITNYMKVRKCMEKHKIRNLYENYANTDWERYDFIFLGYKNQLWLNKLNGRHEIFTNSPKNHFSIKFIEYLK